MLTNSWINMHKETYTNINRYKCGETLTETNLSSNAKTDIYTYRGKETQIYICTTHSPKLVHTQ